VRVLTGRAAVATALTSAGGLLTATTAPVCARPEWLLSWLEVYRTVEPVAVLAGPPDDPHGLACLAVWRSGPVRTVTLLGDGASDYGRLPARDEPAAARLADGIAEILAGIRRPWRLRLAQLPVGDPVAGKLRAMLPGARLVPGQGCPRLLIGADRRIERLLSSQVRHAARQGRNRLAKQGLSPDLELVVDPTQIRALLPEVVALHRDRDHSLGRRSDLDDPDRLAFYTTVAARLADARLLEVLTLRLEGVLAAYLVGIPDTTAYRLWDGRISMQWPKARLGRLLDTAMVATVLSRPQVSELDWMRGELPHKLAMSTDVLPTEHLLAESSAPVRGLDWAAAELRRGARSALPDGLRRRLRGLPGRGTGGSGPDVRPAAG
jgi:CelD/BcsL family acetyltransferase involved in cellulose biosynthesis